MAGVSKETRVRYAREAVENLTRSIAELEADGASEASLKPYRDAMANWEAKLAKLTLRPAKGG